MRNLFTQHRLFFGALLCVSTVVVLLGVRRVRGVTVDVIPVQAQALVQTVIATGRVMSPARVNIGSVITGRVARVLVEEGDHVEGGQVLIELENEELTAALQQAEANEHHARVRVVTVTEVGLATATETLAQARATLDWSEREFRRRQDLLAEGILSRARFEEAERAYLVAKSQYEAAQTQVRAQRQSGAQAREAAARLAEASAARELASAKLAQTQLRASAASIVLTRQVEPGDIVQPGKTLLTLATIGETRITAQIDEKNLPYLKVGETALASADAFPDMKFSADLYYLAPSIDAERGTVEARLRVPDPPAHLRADMTLTVEVRVAHKEHVFVVPSAVVRGTANGMPTLLTVQGGKAVSQPVTLGMQAGGKVEILQGVQAGALVVMNESVTPGACVRPRVVSDIHSEVLS
ncbi:MAG: efflux RND transporter periplasmic adaptor subunit [Candidatus Binatia bacterium]